MRDTGGKENSDEATTLDGVITHEELSKAQRYDKSLKGIREKARMSDKLYFWKEGILMREPYHIIGKDLIIIPKVARNKILALAYNIPIAGDFGRDSTLHSIRSSMDWPSVAREVEDRCTSFSPCQKAGSAIRSKAPLYPLLVMPEPLERISMDVFGPLARTKSGNNTLVLMDYSTKWPDAFALKNVTIETIVNYLVDVSA